MEPGSTLGHFEIGERLGTGGMGEVYRARDPRLGRDVAIKMVLPSGRDDPDRLQRLRREARALATLRNPHVATIHDIIEEEGGVYLVLELVAGRPLGEILRQGPLPRRRAIELGRDVAAGLEAAHAQGILHRDLKPGNVMVTEEGAKLVDFGLARDFVEPLDARAANASTQEAISDRDSVAGTLHYMSPEQLRGQSLDARSDAWAFGCVMYEMLGGRPVFEGNTRSDITAAILTKPVDWSLLEGSPPKLIDLIRRCLRRDARDRLHAIADARIELEELLAAPETGDHAATTSAGTTGGLRSWLPTAVAAAALVVAGWALWGRPGPEPDVPMRRFTIQLGGDEQLSFGFETPPSLAISRDGQTLAYVVRTEAGQHLEVRRLDSDRSRSLADTRGARAPFFSPDGEWIGFFAEGSLRKIPAADGAAVTLAEAPVGLGGTWLGDDTIVFAAGFNSPLMRVSASGGVVEAFTSLRPDEVEQGHHAPVAVGDAVLFTIWGGGSHRHSRIAVRRLGADGHRVILVGGSHPRYDGRGRLVYARASALLAVDYDVDAHIVRGTPAPIFDGVQATPYLGSPLYGLSDEGTLLYAPLEIPEISGRLVLVAPDREPVLVGDVSGPLSAPRFSPDGSRIAFQSAEGDSDVWTYDLDSGVLTRITRARGWEGFPVWSPDGERLAFASAREGPYTLFTRLANGAGDAIRLLPPDHPRWPTSWSPDGRWLLYTERTAVTSVMMLDVGSGESRAVVKGDSNYSWARFSPDGEWIVFESDESGRDEIFVQHRDDPTRRAQVSSDGGAVPFWISEGEVAFHHDPELWAVRALRDGRIAVGTPRPLVRLDGHEINDIAPDGQAYLAVEEPRLTPLRRLDLILGWRSRTGPGS